MYKGFVWGGGIVYLWDEKIVSLICVERIKVSMEWDESGEGG